MNTFNFSYNLHSAKDLDPLLHAIGDASVVMLGEASHGTHEFYTWRSAISKRLIEEKNFNFIAVEGDWPDCYRINRYVKGYSDAGKNIHEVLLAFNRWPTWMWANWEIAALAEWMKKHNAESKPGNRAGFYGLDVYSLWESMEAILNYLKNEDPVAAKAVKNAIDCFEPFEREGQIYGQVATAISHSCKEEVAGMLKEIKMKAQYYDGDPEAALNAEQNALIAVNAEKYYRSMMGFDNQSWNIRDTHMMETLHRLFKFHGEKSKAIVWEHNTHIGDARYTDMHRAGMVNTGQLAREYYGQEKVFLAGFATYTGKVIAAEGWGSPMEEMDVPFARDGSIEAELHNENPNDRMLIFNKEKLRLDQSIPHRAIGVVYNPENERTGNYVPSIIPLRYNALIYIDETKALHPLHMNPDGRKMPETYPFGV